MVNFWDVLFNQVAVSKFLHTISSVFLACLNVCAGNKRLVSSSGNGNILAKRSMLIAGIFGLLSSLLVAYTGDTSARTLQKPSR